MTRPQPSKLLEPQPLEDNAKLLRAIFYGDFGQGKTTLAGKVLEALGGTSLDITADSCWTVLGNSPSIRRLPYQSYGEGTTFGMFEDISAQYGDGTEIQNLLIDPMSTIVEIARRHWTRVKKFEDQRDPEVSSWTHYSLVRDKFADSLTGKGRTKEAAAKLGLNQTKLNIIYICHLRPPPEVEKSKGKILQRPSMPEKTYEELAKECNLVGFCYKEARGQKYLIQTEGTLSVAAKSQIPTVPQTTFPQEVLPELIKKWRES